MKSVLISIRPQWVEKIVRGEKTVEVRKTAPKEVPFKDYIYCSYGDMKTNYYLKGRGKVIGEFICDKVDEYTFSHYKAEYRVTHDEQKSMCLNQPELIRYGKGKTLYGWHISDLKIYDKPKELSEFYRPCSYSGICYSCNRFRPNGTPNDKPNDFCDEEITRPPQSYMFVKEVKQ